MEFDANEIEDIRELVSVSNRELGEDGRFSLELYDQMLDYVDEYRQAQAEAGADAVSQSVADAGDE